MLMLKNSVFYCKCFESQVGLLFDRTSSFGSVKISVAYIYFFLKL